VIDVAGALAVKLLALTAIYFLFFAAPPKIDATRLFVSAISASPR
jgi:hypothetical protein